MGISTNQVRFLALTNIQHNINIKQVTETSISQKVEELTSKYKTLLENSNDLINPFAMGDTVQIGSRITSILPDDTFVDKNGEELSKIPTQATIKNISGNDVSLKVGDNTVSIKMDQLLSATDKTQYTPEEFLSLTGNAELGNITFDSESYLNYNIDTNIEQSIFVNGMMQSYSASFNATEKSSNMINSAIGEEHATINNTYNATKAIIGDKEKKSLAFVG